ncbi:MAG: protein translocase subunit SecF [Anaerolineae bacterium]|nr:protein translocase subunit SecF [Anaerolineae bacterium]MDW8069559.1 protein translocase subunit SecF [Anaerolineae bacterium]
MFNLVEKRRWFFIASAILILLSIGMLVLTQFRFGMPLRLAVDFTGGSLFVLHFEGPATETAIQAVFAANGLSETIIQRLGRPEDNTWQVRTREVTPEQVQAIFSDLAKQGMPVDRNLSTYESVSPIVGGEVTRAAGIAIAGAAFIIVVFIWWSFRRVPHSVRYGVSAIAAMFHALIIVIGFYALMGLLQGWEVDALFLTAVLTVTSFSVQDTIVMFDRIRENIHRYRDEPFERIANRSILETIHRSLATQLNAIFVMIAIILFGGTTIRPFISAMLAGMLVGTYSSFGVAVPLVVAWEQRASRRAKKGAS